jgi:hypothetical protein
MEPMNHLARPATRRVLMQFMCRRGWQISFLEEDCRTPLRRKLTFATTEKIFEMYDRWGEKRSEAEREDLERSIGMGRPESIWLLLTEEQYRKLRQ